MTTPVSVPPLIQAAPWPALGAPNYNDLAYAAGSTQPTAFERQHEIAEATYTNAISASENAILAAASASQAADVERLVTAASNFKGMWSSLSGALNKPASVKHNGRFWLLLNNLANVAASQPGVSADWTPLESVVAVQEITTSITLTPGIEYAVKTPSVTVAVPAGMALGDTISVRNVSGGDIYINWGAYTVKDRTPQSPMPVHRLRGFSVTNTGSTLV